MRRSPTDPWRRVIYKAGIAEIITVYHGSTPLLNPDRLFDTQFANWDNTRRTVSQADAGPDGTTITLMQNGQLDPMGPTVVAECRDRGIAWICKQFGALNDGVWRGKELALWTVYDAGNYDFITEYAFRDDGTIAFRVGATGFNHPLMPEEPHMHDIIWRVDMDLNGAAGDSVYLGSHSEPLGTSGTDWLRAEDLEQPFNAGSEGPESWSAERFNTVIVEDAATNAWGNHLAYELQPLRPGTARHFGSTLGSQEDWALYDFWVNRWKGSEDPAWAYPWKTPDDYLFAHSADGQSITNADVVLYYRGSGHHHPTDEDRSSAGSFAVTNVHWIGFELHPHDLFDANPLGGPQPCL
jgi:Cu2+-containing amine oxidase